MRKRDCRASRGTQKPRFRYYSERAHVNGNGWGKGRFKSRGSMLPNHPQQRARGARRWLQLSAVQPQPARSAAPNGRGWHQPAPGQHRFHGTRQTWGTWAGIRPTRRRLPPWARPSALTRIGSPRRRPSIEQPTQVCVARAPQKVCATFAAVVENPRQRCAGHAPTPLSSARTKISAGAPKKEILAGATFLGGS